MAHVQLLHSVAFASPRGTTVVRNRAGPAVTRPVGPPPSPLWAGSTLDPSTEVPILKVHVTIRTTPTPTACASDDAESDGHNLRLR